MTVSHYVLKTSADPASDLYALYSTNTDAVLTVGTRDAMRRYLVAEAATPLESAGIDARLERADRLGSSCLAPAAALGYDDDIVIIGEGPGGPGYLPRNDLHAYCAALDVDDDEAAGALVRPHED